MKVFFLLAAALVLLSARARADDRDTIDRLRVDLGKDMIDEEGDREAIRRDRAALRSAKDAYDEAVDGYGKNSAQAFRALSRMEHAQLALHRDLGDLQPALKDITKDKKALAGLAKDLQVKKLARAYDVSPQTIAALRGNGWSWSDIGHALALAKATGKPLAALLTERESGKGWGDIAAENHLDPASVDKQARAAEMAGEAAESRQLEVENATRRGSTRERGAHGGHGLNARRR